MSGYVLDVDVSSVSGIEPHLGAYSHPSQQLLWYSLDAYCRQVKYTSN